MAKAIFKFNNGAGAMLCSSCSRIIKTGTDFTEEERLAMYGKKKLPPQYCHICSVRKDISEFKTKYPQGFIKSEIEELLKKYPDIDMESYHNATMGNTCMIINEEVIEYHHDIERAIICGIEKRPLRSYEWD